MCRKELCQFLSTTEQAYEERTKEDKNEEAKRNKKQERRNHHDIENNEFLFLRLAFVCHIDYSVVLLSCMQFMYKTPTLHALSHTPSAIP